MIDVIVLLPWLPAITTLCLFCENSLINSGNDIIFNFSFLASNNSTLFFFVCIPTMTKFNLLDIFFLL